MIGDLSLLKSATGWFIDVVFDAYMNREARSGSSNNNKPVSTINIIANNSASTIQSNELIVTYTSSSETADNYIERRFSELQQSGFNNMIVATNDNMLRYIIEDDKLLSIRFKIKMEIY